MRLSAIPALAALACLTTSAFAVPDPEAGLKALLSRTTSDVLVQLQKDEVALAKRGIEASCTVKNIAIRKEL